MWGTEQHALMGIDRGEEDFSRIHPTRVALDLYPPKDPGKRGTVAARLLIVWFQVNHIKFLGCHPLTYATGRWVAGTGRCGH